MTHGEIEATDGHPTARRRCSGQHFRHSVEGETRRPTEHEQVARLEEDVRPRPTSVRRVPETEHTAITHTEGDNWSWDVLITVGVHPHMGPDSIPVDEGDVRTVRVLRVHRGGKISSNARVDRGRVTLRSSGKGGQGVRERGHGSTVVVIDRLGVVVRAPVPTEASDLDRHHSAARHSWRS